MCSHTCANAMRCSDSYKMGVFMFRGLYRAERKTSSVLLSSCVYWGSFPYNEYHSMAKFLFLKETILHPYVHESAGTLPPLGRSFSLRCLSLSDSCLFFFFQRTCCTKVPMAPWHEASSSPLVKIIDRGADSPDCQRQATICWLTSHRSRVFYPEAVDPATRKLPDHISNPRAVLRIRD